MGKKKGAPVPIWNKGASFWFPSPQPEEALRLGPQFLRAADLPQQNDDKQNCVDH
jgi:hypothetical protein